MLSIKNNKNRRFFFSRERIVYSKKSYNNPFFRHKKPRFIEAKNFHANKLIISAAIVVLLIFLWLIFFSNLFKITKIEIAGVGENQSKEIESIASNLAKDRLLVKNNLLLFNKKELSRVLNSKYFIESLTVKKKLLHTLKITVKEKQQVAVWHEDDRYYYLDDDGNSINQVDALNINRLNYPLIDNLTDIKIKDRQVNIDRAALDYILGLFMEFKDKKHRFEVERFILDNDINTVKVGVINGPLIYFNIKETIEKQAVKLDLIIKEKLKDDFQSKEYIDLRYGNNIYIK